MNGELGTSELGVLLGLAFGSLGDGGNRLQVEGLTTRAGDDTYEIAAQKLEVTSARVSWGPLVLELGRLALHQLVARVQLREGRPRLRALEAARGELSGVKLQGPLAFPQEGSRALHHHAAAQAAKGGWLLAPLAAADGVVRAEIIDAHLLFDADVTVPIRDGRINFNDATVAHVGPDSRMGISRFGLYVDAPNGRSYLYQFDPPPVSGVEYERRGALLGPWVTDRGRLQLQPFLEALLRQGPGGAGPGFTTQARLLLNRTSVSGDIRLGDGTVALPGLQAELTGRAKGLNAIRLRSEAVGRGLGIEMDALSARNLAVRAGPTQLRFDQITGTPRLRLSADGAQLGFALEIVEMAVTGLHLDLQAAE